MSTAGQSYEAWKTSLQQAEAEGGAEWSEESEPVTTTGLVPLDLKGMVTGVLLGAGLLLASCIILLINFSHFTRGERTVGIVVGYKDFYQRGNFYAPVVNYSAPGGVYKVVGRLSVSTSVYPIDREVPVIYLRDDPHNAVIVDFVQMFLIPSVVGGLGLFILAGTAAIMFFIARSELPSGVAILRMRAKQAPPANTDGEKEKSNPWQASTSNEVGPAEPAADSPDLVGVTATMPERETTAALAQVPSSR
jgi:hypothetical protein